MSKTNQRILGAILLVSTFIGLMVYFFDIKARRNAERLRDVQTITNALHQYATDHRGAYPPELDANEKQIGSAQSNCQIATPQCSITEGDACVNLGLSLESYLDELPEDPKSGSAEHTHYAVRLERSGGFLVTACDYSE